MPTDQAEPRTDHLDEGAARRVRMTVSCRDADAIAKVPNAGDVVEKDGVAVQIMHNGLVVEEGCYYGPWMTEIIRTLHGHHEPQEELVFHAVLERVSADVARRPSGSVPTMIEFGSFWTYYGMWFAQRFPQGRVVAMEPDPAYLEVGRRNWALNDLSARVDFVHGAVGDRPGEQLDFVAESDGRTYAVVQHDLHSLMTEVGVEYADVVLSDIQGAEAVLLARAAGDLKAGRVRFLVVSTHHHQISGSPLTHQDALRTLLEAGAHVIAEHSVSESFSGDGLIAVSFDPRDADWTLDVSHARAQDSLFGGLEPDLNHAWHELRAARAEAEQLRAELARALQQRAAAEAEIRAIHGTKLWRLAEQPRRLYARARRR